MAENNAITAEVGVTGLEQAGGRINEEFLVVLKGNRAIKTYREMSDNDPVVGAILFAVRMLLRNVDWRVEPADATPQAVDIAEFVETCRHDMSHTWEDLMDEIISMLVFGWSYHEIVYKKRIGPEESDATRRSKFSDGMIGWRKLPIRSQDSLENWVFDEDDGSLRGMNQSTQSTRSGGRAFIPIEKGMLFRTTSHKNNPEGRSALRNAYRPWFFKKRIEEIEGIGIERDLAGLPVIHAPAQIMQEGASADEKATLENLKTVVRNIRRDEQEGVIMPSAFDDEGNSVYKLELLTTGGSRQFNTTEIISRYDKRIAMTVLADFILLGQDKVGSFALSSDKTALFASAIATWLKSIADVFNRFTIPRLMTLNGISQTLSPKLVPGDVEKVDVAQFAEIVSKLTLSGILIPDEPLQNKARELLDLPPVEDSDLIFDNDDDDDITDNNTDHDNDDDEDDAGSNP
jgi:phage gp29-like protein